MAYPSPPTGLPSHLGKPRPPAVPRGRGWGATIKAWLAKPAFGDDPDSPRRGTVLALLVAAVASAGGVALYDRRYAVKEEVEEGPGSAKAELKAAKRDAASSVHHLKGAATKAVSK